MLIGGVPFSAAPISAVPPALTPPLPPPLPLTAPFAPVGTIGGIPWSAVPISGDLTVPPPPPPQVTAPFAPIGAIGGVPFSAVPISGDLTLPDPSGLPGSGSSSQRRFPELGHGFPGDARVEPKRKTHRPIWDIAKESGKIEQPKPAPRVIQPPPQSLFAKPQRAPLNVSTLPTFNQFVPPNLIEMGRQMQDSQDMSDALAALKAVLAKNKQQ